MMNNFLAPLKQTPNAIFAAVVSFMTVVCQCGAAIPSIERILPADTLMVVGVPDVDKMHDAKKLLAQARFWSDPAMKPFTDKFMARFNAEFVAPLERELGIRLDDFTSLPHGLAALALTRSGGVEKEKTPGMVFLMDTRDKSLQLKTNLTNLRAKWLEAGKTMRTEKLHGVDFMELSVSAEDMPNTLKKFFSDSSTELPVDDTVKKPESKATVVIGQFESLLIVGNTAEAVDNVARRLAGGSAPLLADVDGFMADQASVLRGAPLFVWVNTKIFLEMSLAQPEGAEPAGVGPMGMFKPEKLIAATGIGGLQSVSVSYRVAADGVTTQIFFRAPQSTRQGLLKVLAGEERDSSPPAFVPADVVKFQRWRLDGQKAWAVLEKMLTDISPSGLRFINYLIDSANENARVKDPDFDLRKQLIGNLGNDFVSYQKAPRDTTMAALNSPPGIFLIGTSSPEKMVGAFQGLFRLMSPSGATDREFLGRKIYTVNIPSNPVGMPEPGQPLMQKLSFVASAGYVALSADGTILEEYLRSAQDAPKALRATAGLSDAAQKVSGMGTGWFGYENQSDNMRVMFEALRKSANSTNINSTPFLSAFSGIPGIGNNLKSWLDFSLLPSFDRVAKYFSFSVFSVSPSVEGVTFKTFAPIPAGLKN